MSHKTIILLILCLLGWITTVQADDGDGCPTCRMQVYTTPIQPAALVNVSNGVVQSIDTVPPPVAGPAIVYPAFQPIVPVYPTLQPTSSYPAEPVDMVTHGSSCNSCTMRY